MDQNPDSPAVSKKELALKALARLSAFIVFMPLVFALTSGTWAYWQAWIYVTVLVIPVIFVLLFLLKNNPALLERRMRYHEPVKEQQRLIYLSLPVFLSIFMLPGLDIRFGWSHVSTPVVLIGDVLVLLSYGLFMIVLRENAFLSRVVEVAQEQKVITTGPYALVRHPMYLSVVIMYLASSIALGSYWTLIPAALVIPTLVIRILSEEKILEKDLPGYVEYQQKTRYRLIPGIW